MITKLKKVTLPIVVGFVSLEISISFCLGLIAGYLIANYFGDKVGSFEIPISRRYKIHLHHWILAFLVLAVVFLTNTHDFFPAFVWGLGGGLLFQGIYCYSDWYRILKKR